MPVSSKDILLTTHLHSDHYIEEFCAAFPGKQLRMEKGQISLQNLVIKSIPASHSNKWPTESTADNFIFIIDIGNLRIVNLGDIEQETFMPEQLRELENIDVLITMLYYSANIDLTNQLKPRIVIPTHIWGSPIMKSLVQQWPAYRWKQDSFVVRRDSLPAETNLLLIGDWGERLGSMYKVPEWHRR
jgi:L-ascorbate metabolism protein UlaG (beta-lactamase superfamily)